MGLALPAVDHPDDATLEAFAAGKLDRTEEHERILDHLEDCCECADRAYEAERARRRALS